jgi:TolA-binding protein
LASGVTAAENAADSSADAGAKGNLLTVALEFARAANDNAAATRIAGKLGKVDTTPTAVTPGTANAPSAASSAQANRRIQLALVALGNKDFAGALKQINEAPEVFTEPAEQVEALYVLAEGKNGLAKDTEALKDAGLEYMRLVARAKASNLKSPRVADALYKTAIIHERIRQPEEAAILYQQVASEFDGTEFATKAGGALARLEKKE